MQLKEIQIKAEQSMLTIVWQLFCSPSTIPATMKFDTGMLTKKIVAAINAVMTM